MMKEGGAEVRPAQDFARALWVLRPTLLAQLTGASIAILAATLSLIWFVAQNLSTDYRLELSERYQIDPTAAHGMFMDALRFAFLNVGSVSILIAVAGSYFLLRNILRPLRQMADLVDRISAGEFQSRLDISAMPERCEIRQLGGALNRMAAKLAALEDLRRRTVSNLAHDILTPLTNLRGYLEGVRDGVIEATPALFMMLEGEIRRLVRLVEDLHQLTLVDADKRDLDLQPVDVETLLAEAASIFQPELSMKGLSIDLAARSGAASIVGDRDQLLRAVRNVLQNAVRYSDDGTVINISATVQGASMRIEVENTGPPIPEAEAPFIFDRFYRGSASGEPGGINAGLGLSIVKEIVEAHGGAASASSLGRSTSIILLLPVDGSKPHDP